MAKSPITLSFAIGDHPHTRAFKSGRIPIDGVRPNFITVEPQIQAYRRMVRNVEFDVCELAPTTYIMARALGAPFVALPVFVSRGFHHSGLVVRPDANIKVPKDLEGKKVGQTLASTDAPFFAPFCKLNGVDIAKVQLLNMDARVRNQALVEGKVDAITGLASSILGAIGASGTPVRFMLYSDYKLVLYGNVALVATPKVLEGRKQMAQAVADGLLEGVKLTITKPAEAQELFLGAVPELKMTATGPQFTRLGMGVQRFSVLTGPEAKTRGLGWAELPKLERMTDFVMQYQAEPGSKRPNIPAMFTNDHVGKVKLTEAEWAAADKETDWVRKALGRSA